MAKKTRRGKGTLFLCNCEGSMELDQSILNVAAGNLECRFGRSFCRTQTRQVREALDAGEWISIACEQEAPRFAEIAAEHRTGALLTTFDLRDHAGWSDEGSRAGPKMAALIAASRLFGDMVGTVRLSSEGVCLVYGDGAAAMEAAAELADHLGVTLMLRSAEGAALPAIREFPILCGTIRSVTGVLGDFQVVADGVAKLNPGGRGAMQFGAKRDGGRSSCDLILDLSGGQPLVTGPEQRDGYVRADPADPAGVARAMLHLAGQVGDFDKPLYVEFDASLCAHSRSGRPGCTRCLEVCPTGAITSAGDTVAIDPRICAGCGNCASVCPSGAASSTLPGADAYRRVIEAMLAAYAAAGGAGPRILLHGEVKGTALIAACARHGRGLPADMLPVAVNEATQVGHAELLAALAAGARQVWVHLPAEVRRRGEATGIDAQVALTRAMLAGLGEAEDRIRVIEGDDPDGFAEALYKTAPPPTGRARVSPLGGRREVTRLALNALAPGGDDRPEVFPLPEGAPYGRVVLDTDACTVCLACAGQCPTGALRANPEAPELRFEEDVCVQCGICVSTCPESALKLEPRFLLADSARSAITLKADEPFACITCGKEFAARRSVERILERLGGKHWMFEDSARADMIMMCADCRVRAQFHGADSPFQVGARPRVRTTDDYLSGELDGEDKPGKPNGSGPPAG